MTALPNKHYSGHCRAAEVHGETPGKESWKTKRGQKVSYTAEG